MTRTRLLLAVASVLAGTTVLFAMLGIAYNPVLLVLAAPFGAAAYVLWAGATGRVGSPRASRVAFGVRGPWGASQRSSGPSGRWRTRAGTGGTRASDPNHGTARFPGEPGRREASHILGVPPDADAETVRKAYRDRVKEVHPDNGGDEAAFRRVAAAYDRLRG